jgi:hypothetical protein
MKFQIEIVVKGIDYATFRRVYYSEELNKDVADAVKLKERTQREHVVLPDGKERRRVHVIPNMHLPAAIEKLLSGRSVSYEETTVFDPSTRSASFAIDSPAGDRVKVHGHVRFLEEPGGVRVLFEGETLVKAFAIGGIIERHIVSEVRSRYAVVERLLQRFVDEGRSLRVSPLSQPPQA